MEILWRLNGIQATFENRHLCDFRWTKADYFLDRISSIMNEARGNEYVPTFEDVSMADILHSSS